jgi:hypothetical protein
MQTKAKAIHVYLTEKLGLNGTTRGFTGFSLLIRVLAASGSLVWG